MRFWLVVLLLALVAVVMVSGRRRRGQGEEETRVAGRRQGRRPGRGRMGGRNGQGEEEEEEEGEVSGRNRWRPPGRRNKGKPGGGRPGRGRPGPGQKKKKKGIFQGNMAMKKCGFCVLKCKKTQRKTFEQCLSANATTPCYGMCVNATENMLDCLNCVGECRSTTLPNGRTPNAWYCVKAGPCKARCKARGNGGQKPSEAPVEEGPEEVHTPPPPAPEPTAWYSKYF